MASMDTMETPSQFFSAKSGESARLSAAELGLIACEVVGDAGDRALAPPSRLGIVAKAHLPAGSAVEHCPGRLVPAWQVGEDFVWYRGAFHNPRLDAPEDESSGAAEAVLPFGWAMLYRQASVADADGPPANVAWRVEPVHQGLPEDEDHDANAGRPCWLHLAVLEPGPGIDEGEELVVDRRLATAPFEGYCGEGHCRSAVNPRLLQEHGKSTVRRCYFCAAAPAVLLRPRSDGPLPRS